MWSLSVPEMIGTSDGFVFGFEVPDRWQPAGGGGDGMEMFRPGSPDDPRTQVITSPWIVMPMQDTRYTTIYGSPQAGMLFVNPDNPCLHSDAVSRAVAPGGTAVQRTYLAAFELPLDEALSELDSRIAHRAATA